jgi:glycosyltransferase involved in cell wall biosynthesis
MDLTPPAVSVVLPTYNRAYIVGEAIQSVLAQSFTDFELIVVDDASGDESRRIVASFPDRRIRYLRHPVNRGCSAAYNTGLHACRAPLVAILDSDDLWSADKLARCVDFLSRYPAAAAVFSDTAKTDGGQRLESFIRATPVLGPWLASRGFPSEVVFTRRELYLCLLQEVPIQPPTLVLRRAALFQTELFRADWPSGSDWEFLLRFARRFRFGYLDAPLVTMRVQADATHRVHEEKDHALILAMLAQEAAALRHAEDRQALRAARGGIVSMSKHLGWLYQAQGRRLRAARAFAAGFARTGSFGLLLRAPAAILR